jgi:hypothetical protein
MNKISTFTEDVEVNSYSQVELEGAVKYRPKSRKSSKLSSTSTKNKTKEKG